MFWCICDIGLLSLGSHCDRLWACHQTRWGQFGQVAHGRCYSVTQCCNCAELKVLSHQDWHSFKSTLGIIRVDKYVIGRNQET